MSLALDGLAVYSMDIAEWESTGYEGAGSGEREIPLTTPIPVATGQTLSVVHADCAGCPNMVWIYYYGFAP